MKERMKDLYQGGSITASGLLKALHQGWLTLEDVVEIVGENNAAAVIRDAKLQEISKACNAVIVSGMDITLGEETVHFNLSIEDQTNIANLFRVVELGGTAFPYQSDGGVCRIYTAAEIAQIYIAAQTLITTQTTYTPKNDEMVMTVHRWYTNKACPGDWLYQRHNVIMDEVNSRLANANGGTKNNESEVLEMNITKDELKAMIRETVVEVYNELNPLYEDIKDVPGYWKGTAQKLLDAEAVNGGTSKEVCATDLNLRRETLKAAIIASLYHDYEESEGAERE